MLNTALYQLFILSLASFNKYNMEEQIKNCRIILGDNMEYMKNIPDKCFDLACVDKINMILLLLYQSIFVSLYQIKNI